MGFSAAKPIAVLLAALLLGGCQSSASLQQQMLNERRAKLHYEIGIDALHKQQLPKAFSELMEADKINPGQPEVLDALALAWRLRGDMARAEEFYKKALSAGAGASTHTNFGNLLVELKRYKEAEKQLRQALQDPSYRNQYLAYINLGDALLGQNRFDEAVEAYRQAKRVNPTQDLSRIREAEAYASYDRLNDAQALYEALLNEYPADKAVLQGLLGVLKRRNDIPAQRRYLERFRKATPSELDRAWASDKLERLGGH